MKKLILTAAILLTSLSQAQARPEMVKLKNDKQQNKEDMARSRAAQVRLSKIQDPEVRKALQAAFDSMGLECRR